MIKECLAIVYALHHWRHYLLRQHFYVDIDHRNFICLFDGNKTQAPALRKNPLITKMANSLAHFDFSLAWLSTLANQFADYLSRDGNVHNNTSLKLIQPKFDS